MPDQIFVSYRRDDAADVAGHINDRLRKEFGDASVFTDLDNIGLGVDFRSVLDQTISKCHILLAIIGENWATAKNPGGGLRLNDPGDFVRIEIESAFRLNIPVIPLLVGGTKMPTEDELPESLRNLAFRKGIRISSTPDFETDMVRLTDFLRDYLAKIRKNAGNVTPEREVSEARGPEDQTQRRSIDGVIPKRAADERKSAVSSFSVQVDESERKRKQTELGINPDAPKKGKAGRIFLVLMGLVIATGASWFGFIKYQEQVQAKNAALAAVKAKRMADAEAQAQRETAAEARRQADAAAKLIADAEAEAKLAADAEALAQQKIDAEIEARLKADADAEAARRANLAAEAARRSAAEAERRVDANALLREGVSLAGYGDHQAAIRNFDEAIRFNVQPAFAHKQRGASHHALGSYQAAIDDYSEALRLSPGDANAYYNRSASHFALQDFDAAIGDCDQAIRIDPKFVGAYYNRGASHEALGNLEAAERDRATAAKLQSNRN